MAENVSDSSEFDVAPVAKQEPTKKLEPTLDAAFQAANLATDVRSLFESRLVNSDIEKARIFADFLKTLSEEKRAEALRLLEIELRAATPGEIAFSAIAAKFNKAEQKTEKQQIVSEKQEASAEKRANLDVLSEDLKKLEKFSTRMKELLSSDPGLQKVSSKIEEDISTILSEGYVDRNLPQTERESRARAMAVRARKEEILANVSEKNRNEVEKELLPGIENLAEKTHLPRYYPLDSAAGARSFRQPDLLVGQNEKIINGTNFANATAVIRNGNDFTVYYAKEIPPIKKVWNMDSGEPRAEIRSQSGLAVSVDIAYEPKPSDLLAGSDHERAVRSIIPDLGKENPREAGMNFKNKFSEFSKVAEQTMGFLNGSATMSPDARDLAERSLRANVRQLPGNDPTRSKVESILDRYDAANSVGDSEKAKLIITEAKDSFANQWKEGIMKISQLDAADAELRAKEGHLATEREEFAKTAENRDEIAKHNLSRWEGMGLGAIGNRGLYDVMERLAKTQGKPFDEMVRRQGAKTELRATEKLAQKDLEALAKMVAKTAKVDNFEELFDKDKFYALRPGINLGQKLRDAGALDENGEFRLSNEG